MQTTIETVFPVRPEVFWQRLFFDADYNQGLYRALNFDACEVQKLERLPDGRITRILKAVPPLSGPEMLKRQLRGRVFYLEEGTFDPARGVWEFVNHSSMKVGKTEVAGTIVAKPHPEGMLHVVTLDISVSALGLGSIIESAIEKGTRESYRTAAEFTKMFAEQHGLLA